MNELNTNVLPIEAVIPALRQALGRNPSAILVAPPGAGKTTRIPLALLDEPWLQGRKIIMLEPRRLAARAVARYMSAQLGEQVGHTIGYRVRMDTRVSSATRIEVITEGVLTRLLQADPALEDTGIVIFDEFHERSLHADLGLALSHQSQQLLREDLRILVMSATIEAEPIASLLGQAPILISEGRAYKVETRYLASKTEGRIEPIVVSKIAEALAEKGDMLVFLPGTGEIRRVAAKLAEMRLGAGVQVVSLHGSLSPQEQDQALAPAPPGCRKIVLATSIAETSLTVDGIHIVIDSGLMRVPRFSPRTGMTRLETVPVSQASADQRRGRAGRLGPGLCFRLWTEQSNRHLAPCSTPEIKEADLTPLVLELAAWGITDPQDLVWLDEPPAAACSGARQLLVQLRALHAADGTITQHGRKLAGLGLHPRLAHMMVQAVPLGLGTMACELAAMLSERDFMRGDAGSRSIDVRTRLETLREFARSGRNEPSGSGAEGQIDMASCRRIWTQAAEWKRSLGLPTESEGDSSHSGLLLAYAYPDRIAHRRSVGHFLLSNGRGAVIPDIQLLSHASFLVTAELDDQGVESRIFLAAPIELSELQTYFPDLMSTEHLIAWDKETQSVRAKQREFLGAIRLKESIQAKPDSGKVLEALLLGILEEGLSMLPWTRAAKQLQERLCFMHLHDSSWPDASEAALEASLADWLAPHVYGMKNRNELQRLNLHALLEGMLSWNQRGMLEDSAPTHITVPSGSRIPVDYSDPSAPVLAVRLQEMFGLADTPRIAGGKIALTLHLLSPAQRPVQVTRDLSSFWSSVYFEVKKDLKGRYPKHYWPDDPLAAPPTNRAKPRS